MRGVFVMDHLKKLVLLHSNDMHGDFLAETVDAELVGGVSMLSGYINQVREEEPNTLYCIAGDMVKGSVIDSEFQGLSTIDIMNALAPDIASLGNHEVDYGVAHLLFLEKCSNFPIVNANLRIKANHARMFEPCKVLYVDGMRILFIGILTEEVLDATKKETLVGSMIECSDMVEEIGKICNSYNALGIDFTVLLTHIGYEEDKKLAAMLDPSWGVDVIIGGHSHTLPEEPAYVNGIPIVQAGVGTDQIGRFDIMVDTKKRCIDSFTWKTIPIHPDHCPTDPKMDALISGYKETTDLKYDRVLTRLARKLTNPGRYQETEVGNLVADALKNSLGLDVMLVGSGTLRMPTFGSIVTFRDFVEMFAFDEPVHMVTVTGKQFKAMIQYMCRDEAWTEAHTEFYQLSEGLEIIYSKSKHAFDQFQYCGAPLLDDQRLTLGLQGYHFNNFEKIFHVSFEDLRANAAPRVISTSVNQVLEEYFISNQLLNGLVQGRLVVVD